MYYFGITGNIHCSYVRNVCGSTPPPFLFSKIEIKYNETRQNTEESESWETVVKLTFVWLLCLSMLITIINKHFYYNIHIIPFLSLVTSPPPLWNISGSTAGMSKVSIFIVTQMMCCVCIKLFHLTALLSEGISTYRALLYFK